MLSPRERAELDSMPTITGEPGAGVLVTPGPVDQDTWLRLNGAERADGEECDRP